MAPAALAELLPGTAVPPESRGIVNVHFRLDAPPPPLPEGSPLLGVVGGTAEWIFPRGDMVSVTVSAADALAEEDARLIASRVWPEVATALSLAGGPGADLPAWRVIKERRATFAQVPGALALRAPTRTEVVNLLLAGDWTDTGLPATIEGAVVSGRAAADAVLGRALTEGRP